MELNSCLYETEIMHHRLKPVDHRFTYRFFSFYLDLDELDVLSQKLIGLSRNRWNMYSFYDQDHIPTGRQNIKAKVLAYLKEKGVELKGGKIMHLTYLRTFGYVFNPVSFYYCFDKLGAPVCVVPQIGNTFGEQKLFFIGHDHNYRSMFKDSQTKYYYISPFTDLDDQLDFKLGIPGEHLNIRIDTAKKNGKVILTSMLGKKKELSARNMLWMTLKCPLITVKVITLIHLHAGILHFFKKVPYHKKNSNPHLQKGVLNGNPKA